MSWEPIETLPMHTDALVCVTYNVPADEDDQRPAAGDGYVWETVMWVDNWWRSDACDCEPPCREWFSFPRLIHVPAPPTMWAALPNPPECIAMSDQPLRCPMCMNGTCGIHVEPSD